MVRPLVLTDPTARWIFTLLAGLWLASETWLGLQRRLGAEATARDRGSRVALTFAIWGGLWLATGLAYGIPGATIRSHQRPVFVAGVALMIAGFGFRLYAIRTLGRYFTYTVAIHPGQHVVQSGPYRWIRHPGYLGALATFFGMCLALTSWLAFLGLLPILAGFAYRISVEERALSAALGDEYRAYVRRTKRLIPHIV